jgi:hypothetical protein
MPEYLLQSNGGLAVDNVNMRRGKHIPKPARARVVSFSQLAMLRSFCR